MLGLRLEVLPPGSQVTLAWRGGSNGFVDGRRRLSLVGGGRRGRHGDDVTAGPRAG